MNRSVRARWVSALGTLLAAWAVMPLSSQRQLVDERFVATVDHPAYARNAGPTVAIDEAHANFHTMGGQYKPFAELLRSDGYKVIASTQPFDRGFPRNVKVLVVANARNLAAIEAGDVTKPAFTDRECDRVRDWVGGGGSLLLVADHAPFGAAAAALAARFGVTMGKGWTFDRAPDGITTQLDFTRQNGLLGDHVILRGRSSSEAIAHVRSFTGQSLSVPSGATPLMKLSATARDAATPMDLDAEGVAAASNVASARGAHSTPASGRAQGLAMSFGNGRVVVLGEAALLSAQLLRYDDGREMTFGMNVPGTDDRQFALNVLHWLSGVLK